MKEINILLKLIRVLSDGKFHSNKKFTTMMGITPADIDKHIQTVFSWGIDVVILSNKGYFLRSPLNLLDENIIRSYLPSGQLTVLPVVDSTNQYLIDRTATLNKGDACIAEYQFQGRGRRGRSWISPFGNNLYFSVYWHFKQNTESILGLSLVVGIVIVEVLQRFGVEGGRLKWPNDLYLNNKKLAGILVEVIRKKDEAAHVIIGVGINVKMQRSMGKIIAQDWINLQDTGIYIDRNKLVSELIATLREALLKFENNGFAPFLIRWTKLDFFLNRPVKLLNGNKEITGIARGINSQGALLLEKNGKNYPYLDGEISLRGL